jgi:hypothetical protein
MNRINKLLAIVAAAVCMASCSLIAEDYKEYLKEHTAKMESEFKSTFYADELILIQLYRKIEKRGFRVLYHNEPLDEKLYYNVELEV